MPITALRQRTQAERRAIDARAGAWVRPLSPTQRQALALLAKAPFKYSVAGWCSSAAGAGLEYFQTPTMTALRARGFARALPTARRWLITAAGRVEARRLG